MKKVLLLMAFFSAIFCGYAQSTIDTALALEEGDITYTNESGSSVEVYYSYTAPEAQGQLLTVSYEGYSINVECSLDGTYNTRISGLYMSGDNTTSYSFPVKPGQKVYLRVSSYSSNTANFNVAIADADVDGGATCDEAIELGTTNTFIPSYYDTVNYSYVPTYAQYTATETGALKIVLSSYISTLKLMTSCDDTNPTTISTQSKNGGVEALIQVEEGKTYYFEMMLSSSPIYARVEMVVLIPGESPITAIEITEAGTYTADIPNASTSSSNYIYYKYTAPANESQLVTVTRSSSSTNCSASLDGSSNTNISGIYLNSATAYPVSAGQTIYLQVGGLAQTSVSFTISMEAADVDAGKTCDDPVILTGEKAFVPSVREGYSTVDSYLSYTCEEDGLLEIHFTGSASGIKVYNECNGTQIGTFDTSYNSTTSEYVGKYAVEAGNTYIFAFSAYSPCYAWVVLTHPVEGQSCDFPFEAAAVNTLPKEAGTYYYGYTVTEEGYLVIDSEENFAGNTISLWSSCTSYSEDAMVTGYMALRSHVNSGYTYVIKIEKTEATAEEGTFTINLESEKPGDSQYNPFTIASIDEPVTLPKYNGTYWYKVQVPAGDNCFLVADANEANINNSRVEIFKDGETYTTLGQGEKYAKAEVQGGTAYLIKWTCNEGINSFNFNIYYEAIEAGTTCNNTIAAVAGENDLNAGSELYYSYTAEQSGWLIIDTDVTIGVTFLRGCNSWDGYYPATKIANINKCEMVAGENCIIKFTNIEEATTFFLSMEDYAEGESCDKAIAIELGDTAIPATVGKFYYSYTAEKDGVLTIESDMVYESIYDGYNSSNNEIAYATDCNLYFTTIMTSGPDGTIFSGNTIVTEGTTIYIRVKTITAQPDKKLTLNIRDLLPGEGCSSPIEIQPGIIRLQETTYNKPVWYSIELEPGVFSVTSTNYFTMELYESCDSEIPLAYSSYDYNSSGYALTYNIMTAGVYLLKQTSQYANDVTVSGVYSDVDKVEGNNDVRIMGNNIIVTANGTRTDVVICDITGKVVAAQAVYDNATFAVDKGIYIVKVADQVKKVAIR